MSKVEDFLTTKEEQEIVEAIRLAEKNTSGELRVHIEKNTSIDAFDRAMDVFHSLKMEETKERNGVLIYLAVKDKTFVIYGDQGINDKVEDTFWDATRDVMVSHFKNGDFKQGLIEGINKAGEELKKYFPYNDDDSDELSNEISRS